MTNELSALCENINEKQHIILSMERETDEMWEKLNDLLDEDDELINEL